MIKITIENLKELPRDFRGNIKLLSPLPRETREIDKSYYIDKNCRVYVEGENEDIGLYIKSSENQKMNFFIEPGWTLLQFSIKVQEWLNERLTELKLAFKILDGQVKVDPGKKFEITEFDAVPDEHHAESYFLSINNSKIEIYSRSMHGAYYGIVTLNQLFHPVKEDNGINRVGVPGAIILDWPRYHVRGLVDDISRGQRPTIDNLKRFVKFLSKSKQNTLVLYIEDIFHYNKHPNIGLNRGRLEPAEIMELQTYAKDWFVNIVPGVEMLGHMENILLDPMYMELAEFPGAQCLDVSNPKTKEFIKDLLSEIVPLFESPIFAPICDESMDFGLGKSESHVKKLGYGKALAEWYLFLINEIQKLGKPVVIFAHDIIYKFPEALQEIKKANALIYYWDYSNKKKYPLISKLANKHGLLVAGGPAVFDWSRHYPYNEFAETNMIEMGKYAMNQGSVGLITTKWGDFSNENFRNNIFYGLLVNGQAAWSPAKSSVDQIKKAFAWIFFGTLDEEIIRCMNILSKQNKFLPRFPNGMFNRYWLDPFIRKIKKKELEIARNFIDEGNQVIESINKLRESGKITLNADILNYISFAARMARHYGAKILISEGAFLNNPDIASYAKDEIQYEGDPILGGFQWLKRDIESQLKDYQDLWLKLAVKEGLEYPVRRFKILAWHYEQAIDALKSGKKPSHHQLKSEWIWRNGLRLKPTWGNKKWYYFTKEFHVDKGIVKKVFIQGIASNHLKIFLNGTFIGEVLSRFSLGLLPMANAVQIFDVTDAIRDGSNFICVDGINWAAGIGGINILIHIEHEDGTTRDVITDNSWIYHDEKPEPWPLLPNMKIPRGFKKVRSFGKPPGAWQGPITQPIWEHGWKSSISFAFGSRNFFETSLPVFVGSTVYKALFWLLPIIAPLFGLDIFGFRKNI
ncbi:MAG: glycoside hydrolase family 20 zincin-like fold domain-containing protein [Promethearchaeota archaeon]